MRGCHNIHALFHGLFHPSFTTRPIQALIFCLVILLSGCAKLYFMLVAQLSSTSARTSQRTWQPGLTKKKLCVCVCVCVWVCLCVCARACVRAASCTERCASCSGRPVFKPRLVGWCVARNFRLSQRCCRSVTPVTDVSKERSASIFMVEQATTLTLNIKAVPTFATPGTGVTAWSSVVLLSLYCKCRPLPRTRSGPANELPWRTFGRGLSVVC
jgi:hypothetical protein